MKHIPGKYAKERAKKSEIVNCLVVGLLHYNYYNINVWPVKVPLGVLLYNENKLDEMSKILDHLMALVPRLVSLHFLMGASWILMIHNSFKFLWEEIS